MISSIIFDLGGVLAGVDPNRTLSGICSFVPQTCLTEESTHRFFQQVAKYERGAIDDDTALKFFSDFIHALNPDLPTDRPTRATLTDIWNSMVISLPSQNLHLLERLKEHYRIYLLSNTNALHMEYVNRLALKVNPDKPFHAYFDRVFTSYELKMAKPDVEIFEEVTRRANLNPAETLFIDDREENVEGARKAGWQAYRLVDVKVESLFEGNGRLRPVLPG